ncbi:MAG: DUF692 domain-containing protein [Zetaproteobacteria bacterium]|nr:DUF692 domain-containing protein [Zetaproteobacteria bacterium]
MLSGVGVSLRPPFEAYVHNWDQVSWLEVLIDNFLMRSSDALSRLRPYAELYPLAFHSVSLSVGDFLVKRPSPFLRQLRRAVCEYQPTVVSDHVCWSSYGGCYVHDLLPLPRTPTELERLVERVDYIQEFLGVPLILENITAYAAYEVDCMSEGEFFTELTQRTGCGVLLDLHNLWVNARNWGSDSMQDLLAMPLHAVKQVHVAGGEMRGQLCVDSHSSRVSDDILALFGELCMRCGPTPVCLEWDREIPDPKILETELQRIANVLQRYSHGKNSSLARTVS